MLHAAHAIADDPQKTAVREKFAIVGIAESEGVLLRVACSNVLRGAGQNARLVGHEVVNSGRCFAPGNVSYCNDFYSRF